MAIRMAFIAAGLLAVTISGCLIVLIMIDASGSLWGTGYLTGAQQAMPVVGILLVVFNVIIAQVARVWVLAVYSVAAATAVNLPYLEAAERHGMVGLIACSWVLGMAGMLGTAFGIRSFRPWDARPPKDGHDPQPPTDAHE